MKYETKPVLNPKIEKIQELGLEGWSIATSMYNATTGLVLFYFQRPIQDVEDMDIPYEDQTVARKAFDILKANSNWLRDEMKRTRVERNKALFVIHLFESGSREVALAANQQLNDLLDYNSRSSPVHGNDLKKEE